MKIKLLTIFLSLLVLTSTGAWAQDRDGGGPGPDGGIGPAGGGPVPGGGGQQGPGASPRALVVFLELDESQVEALGMMLSDNAQALRPLFQSALDNQAALRAALAADPPDETAVGRLVLAGRGIEREAGMLRQSQLEAAPDALNLSPDQRDKLQLLQTSLRVAPIAQIAASLNLVSGPALGSLFVQGDFSTPFPVPPFGGIPGRTGGRQRTGDMGGTYARRAGNEARIPAVRGRPDRPERGPRIAALVHTAHSENRVADKGRRSGVAYLRP